MGSGRENHFVLAEAIVADRIGTCRGRKLTHRIIGKQVNIIRFYGTAVHGVMGNVGTACRFSPSPENGGGLSKNDIG